MDKKKVISIILSAILVFAVSFKFYLDYKDMNKDEINSSDIIKFKEEYESLNGTVVSGDIKYNDLNIDKNVEIYYKTDKEIVELLKNGTGVIYFGFNSCPWCRSMIETLFKVVKDNNNPNFYYSDIKNIRSTYEIQNNELKKTKNGTESYYELIELLDAYLKDFIVKDKDNKEYETGEKRLYAPTVVVVKEGEIIGYHEVTVESQTDAFAGLNEEQEKELYDIYNEMIKKIKDVSCEKPGC